MRMYIFPNIIPVFIQQQQRKQPGHSLVSVPERMDSFPEKIKKSISNMFRYKIVLKYHGEESRTAGSWGHRPSARWLVL